LNNQGLQFVQRKLQDLTAKYENSLDQLTEKYEKQLFEENQATKCGENMEYFISAKFDDNLCKI